MPNEKSTSVARAVRERIAEAIIEGAETDAARINVGVHGSRVVLTGSVRSWAEHEDAETAARAVDGVTEVDNQLALLVKATLSTH